MNRKLTASLLILAAVLANVAFTALGSIFNYPDVLDEPAGEVLASFRDHEGAVSAWFSVLALSAALLAPIAIGVGRLSPTRADAHRGAGRDRGGRRAGRSACCAGRSSCPATRPTPPAPTRRSPPPPATRSRRRATSSARPSARRSATCSPPRGRRSSSSRSGARYAGRWFPVLGGASAALVLVGVLSPLDLPGHRHRELPRLRPVERLADRVRAS